MKSILDPSFHYTRSFETDLHKTFARIRREQRRRDRSQVKPGPVAMGKVLTIKERKVSAA